MYPHYTPDQCIIQCEFDGGSAAVSIQDCAVAHSLTLRAQR